MTNPKDKSKIIPDSVLAFLNDQIDITQFQLLAQSGAKIGTEIWLNKFVTRTQSMIALKDHVRKLAPLSDPVLIQGESGTGKELIARALHGDRSGKFIPVNCSGLPEHLVESELFGHVKGSFTGADKDKIGLLTEAENGTLFLDEIGDLSFQLQAKLLRAIQEAKIRAVGANTEVTINCRFVCATHHKLLEQMKKGLFRDDLYWRISTFTLEIKPLALRKEDIIPIIESIDIEKRVKLDDIDYIVKDPETYLAGNVRSLQQIIRRYLVLGMKP